MQSFQGNDDVVESHGMHAMECFCDGHTFHIPTVLPSHLFYRTHVFCLIERNLEPPFFEGARSDVFGCLHHTLNMSFVHSFIHQQKIK